MKLAELSVAGKTFLAGEYLALTGGPALVLSTEPRFRLQVSRVSKSPNPFHPESPAGKLWLMDSEFFSQYQLKFIDPYQIGGFGASSAQFALLHAFYQLKEEVFGEAERFFDWHQMLKDYRALGKTEGQTPSGADIVGVCAGGITWFDRNNGKLQTFAWPFAEFDFFVAHTGKKLATHEHLKALPEFSVQGFEEAMGEIQRGLSHLKFDSFVKGLRMYRRLLTEKGWVAEHTAEKLKILDADERVLFAKGCGAMGSDVILVLCEKYHSKEVQSLLWANELQVIADSSQLGQGLQIRNLSQPELTL